MNTAWFWDVVYFMGLLLASVVLPSFLLHHALLSNGFLRLSWLLAVAPVSQHYISNWASSAATVRRERETPPWEFSH